MRTVLAVIPVALAIFLFGCSKALPTEVRSIAPSGSLPPSMSPVVASPSSSIAPETSSPGPASSDSIVVYGLAFADAKHGLLVGGSSWEDAVGVVWQTSDGGQSWKQTLTGTGPLDAVTIAPSGRVWIATACDRYGRADCVPGVFVRRDGEAAWTPISTEPVSAMSFPSDSTGWAVSADRLTTTLPAIGLLVSSHDGGRTWRQHPSPCPPTTGWPVGVSFPDARHGWVACNGNVGAGNATKAIVATIDGGNTWMVMASAPWPGKGKDVGSIGTNGYLDGIAMAANGRGMIWMGRGFTDRTADAGRTWIDMPPAEFDVREAVAGWAFDDRNWLLYVWNASDEGPALEASHDGGRTWSIISVIPAPAAR